MSSADTSRYYCIHRDENTVGLAQYTLQIVEGGGRCIVVDSVRYYQLKHAGRIVSKPSANTATKL